ncbi:MAG: hypothetical protein AAFX52_11160 [Pseudomonadota bacterium]
MIIDSDDFDTDGVPEVAEPDDGSEPDLDLPAITSDGIGKSVDEVTLDRLNRRQEEDGAGKQESSAEDEGEAEEAASDEDDESEEADDDGSNTDEEADDNEAAAAIDPPQFWGEEDREAFRDLPREAQELVVKADKKAVAAVNAKQMQIATKVKEATEAERSKLSDALQDAELLFEDRFANVSDEQLVAAVNDGRITEAEAFNIQTQRKEDAAKLRQLRDSLEESEKRAAETAANELRSERQAYLLEHAPELLTDPKLAESVVRYALDQGYEDFGEVTGRDLHVLHKAMLYDAAKDKANAKPAKTAPKKTVKPKKTAQAGTAAGNPILKKLEAKAKKTGALSAQEMTQLRLLRAQASSA